MHIEFLLEEESAEDALSLVLPKILPAHVTFQTHVFSGKANLKSALPDRLKGYASWMFADSMTDEYLVVILIDRDREDCHALKLELEAIVRNAGLESKTAVAPSQSYQVVNRIAIEELEAWFFGDVEALRTAYPGVPATLSQKQAYRNPDSIRGGTAESLLRVLQRAGHFAGLKELPKREAARTIAAQMDPGRNISPSFKLFYTTLREATGGS